MYIIYFLVLCNSILAHESDNCNNNKVLWTGSQLPHLNETVINYRDKSGDCFFKLIKQMENNDFDKLVLDFEKTLDATSLENAKSRDAVAAHVASFYIENQKAIVVKRLEAQGYPALHRFSALIKRFHADMSALWKVLNKSDNQNKVRRYELPCGSMSYMTLADDYGQKHELKQVLNAFYIERTQLVPFKELLQKFSSDKATSLPSKQYNQFRLLCFEEILRFSLKNNWNSLYVYPTHVLLNDILVRAIYGKGSRFLYKSKMVTIDEFLDKNPELLEVQEFLQSLIIKLECMPLNVKSMQFYNNESVVYVKPEISTPTLYFNYLKSLRKNHWMCRYIQVLYKQANGAAPESWFIEDESFDQELKAIIGRVFEEFDLYDPAPDELQW